MIKPETPNLKNYAERAAMWYGWALNVLAEVRNVYTGTIPPTCDVYVLRWQTAYSRVPLMSVGGFYWCPQVGDLVLLAFLDGRKDAPYIVGELLTPKTGKQLDDPKQVLVQNAAGVIINLDAQGGITIKTPAGATVGVDPQGNITVSGNNLTINASGNI
ncbi:MAG: phage baseplate assembly protein V, partial [Moorellaceae bacterium]